jgi:hypothetical protein
VADSYKHKSENVCSIKGAKLLEEMYDCQFVKEDCSMELYLKHTLLRML